MSRADQAVRLTRALELIEDASRSLALPRLGGNPERQLASAETILRGVRDDLAGVK